jgi:diguanylate cyclase (GGDEF)-like protein
MKKLYNGLKKIIRPTNGKDNPVFRKISDEFRYLHDIPMEIAIYDINGKYKYVNKRYVRNYEDMQTLIGKDDSYYFDKIGISKNCISKRNENFQRTLKEKKTINFTEKLYYPAKERTFYYSRYFQPIFSKDNEITSICLFGNDLTGVIIGQKELKYLAYHDRLTGLRNREGFYEHLDQIIIESERETNLHITAILLIDIDNFKLVNDSFGHDIGDIVLREISSRLNICLRKSDYCFRVGGDEFFVIIKNIKHEWEIAKVAEKIIRYLSTPYIFGKYNIKFLTCSMGIVLFPKDGINREKLIKNADIAMYNAKKRGKNNYQFYSTVMTASSVKRMKIEKNLNDLVNRNDYENQLEIVYQPIVENKKNGDFKVIGSEALLRWKNPELGNINPDTFIPIAEERNLISEIGDWILYKTLRDFKLLINKYNPELYISINFSAIQLKSKSMIKRLVKILKTVNFNPERLQLELTETSYLDDHEEIITNIKELENLGIKLALDDFGVGFASLSYLQKIPATTIKIDKSFIHSLSYDLQKIELVKSIIMLGKNLNKDVIAEGVEHLEDLYLLKSQNCYKYQGHLFSEALSLKKFKKYLQKNNLTKLSSSRVSAQFLT